MIKREDKLEQKSAAKPEGVTVELSDSELDRVAGGDITISKRTDVSSSDLFLKCANGKHYD
jgi:type VI protein secretion system component Hcp